MRWICCVALLAVGLFCSVWTRAEDVPNGDKMLKAAEAVQRYTGLKPKRAAAVEFLADETRMREVFRNFFHKEYPEDKYQAMNALMLKFGFGLFENDSEDEIIKNQTRGILGVYDHDTGIIYVVSADLFHKIEDTYNEECNLRHMTYSDPETRDWWNKHLAEMTLVHETTHAIEDQYYDLGSFETKFKHNDDAYFAIKSVSEGMASMVEDSYTTQLTGWTVDSIYGLNWELKDFARLDAQIEKNADSNGMGTCKSSNLTFLWWMTQIPYFFGELNMFKVRSEQGKEKMGDMYVKCPLSSKQIMNSERYFNKDKEDLPTFVNLPSFDDLIDTAAMRYLDYNSMGQFKLYLLCRDMYLDAETTCVDAVKGWEGDRYLVWRNADDEIVYVWFTTWANENDAEAFYDFYLRAWNEKKVGDGARENWDNKVRVMADEESMQVERRGTDVAIIEGPLDKDKYDAFSDRLWTATKYKATYDICTMAAADFHDGYVGDTGEKKEESEKSSEEDPNGEATVEDGGEK